jgi:uncharacterized membrane protein YraQ (UPF0718 family)
MSGIERGNLFASLGALLGVLALAAMSDDGKPLHGDSGAMHVGDTFLTLALQIAPALLLGLLLAGLSKVYLPQPSPRWLRAGRAGTRALRGVGYGLLLPVRSYDVTPMYRLLIRGGVPLATAMAFLVATPALGLEAAAISLPLLGLEITAARVLGVVLLALGLGAVVGRLSRSSEPPASEPVEVATQGSQSAGLRVAVRDLVDDVGPWLLLGLIGAALIEPLVDPRWLAPLPAGVDIVIFTLLGLPLYVPAVGATPLVAMLIRSGVSPGAAVAFLLVGPAVHLTVARMLARMHGRGVAIAFTGAVAGLAALMGLLTNAAIGQAHGPALLDARHQAPGIVDGACLAALAVLLALSVLRLGPRGFVGRVLFPRGDEHSCAAGCDDHSNGHHDAHGASGGQSSRS